MPIKKNNQNGFTLLELLIALFVFTILSMIMVAGLHSVTTSQATTEKRAERLAELQVALTLISRDFEQIVNRPISVPNGSENAFIGYPQSVFFTHGGVANPLGQLHRSTLQRTNYIIEDNKLIRITWPVLDYAGKIQPDQRVLITGVKSLRFQYLDEKNKFTDRWPPPDQTQVALPKAIRITIELQDSGKLSQLYVMPAQNLAPTPEKKPEPKPPGPNSDLTT
jgi:general secretion pathway protein J